jgi:hypothetical protein
LSRKLIALNLVLLALGAGMIWLLRLRWLEVQAHERAIFEQAAHARAVLPLPPVAAPKPVAAADYLDVAQKTLFSKDRNPVVVIELPPPKPEPPLPALPFYHGQMTIGEPVVFLSTVGNGDQRGYHAGEKVGPFELVSFDRESITFDWNGKTVERKLQELVPKETPPAPSQAAAQTFAPAPSAAAVSLAPSPLKAVGAEKEPSLGVDMGAGYRGCVGGDNSPSGTVKDGYRKIVVQTMFGQSCHWELVK